MGEPIVLLTGATGFIGLRILQGLLNGGYAVRAAVRSEQKGEWLFNRVEESGQCPAKDLSTIVVPNFTAKNAFREAAYRASYIIHVASPITSSDDPSDWEHDFVETAIKGSTEILEAADHSKTVKRVIFTSSMVAMLPLFNLFKDPGDRILDADSRSSNMKAPYPAKMMAYAAGKIAALNAAEAWIADHKTTFDIIHMCPSFVVGRDDTVTTAQELCKGSNWHPLSILLGTNYEIGKPALTCHIDDVVRCHVLGLEPTAPGNQCYLISIDGSDGTTWDDAKIIVQEKYTDAVHDGRILNNGHMPTVKTRLDVSKTEKVFSFKHKSYAEQIEEVTTQYLDLLERDRQLAKPAATRSLNLGIWAKPFYKPWIWSRKFLTWLAKWVLVGFSVGIA
jgi:nucleoside-diphosphate-sugar epimerase